MLRSIQRSIQPLFFSLLAALLALPAAAQTIPPKGTGATFDVATWNIEWFGGGPGPSDNERQLDNVEAVIEASQIDLWALQEVADVATFNRLLDSLGAGYAGLVRENTSPGVTQRIGFVYRRDVVRLRGFEQILTQYAYEFASRPPLKIDVEITLPDTTVALSLITVHMKAEDGDADSYERRREAARLLKNRIDFLYPSTPIIVLGDFNDELRGSIAGGGRTTPYQAFIDDAARYRFLTMPFDEANLPTWCGNSTSCASGSTLDHILITDELFGFYEEGSVGRYTELTGAIPGYVSNTSDHLPVYARFRFATRTAVEGAELPRGVTLGAPYPNPFHDAVAVRYTLDRAAAVRVEVFDLLGRRVAVLADGLRPAGAYEATFAAGDLPEGIYLVRLQAGAQTAVRRVVRVR